MTQSVTTAPTLGLRVGDMVEVRSVEEILATLDSKGELENLPFMPEMVRFCGQRMTVHKVAHKLCDTISRSGIRKMENSVHLAGARCDGSAHGGCQTACSMYWKEAWLQRVEPGTPPPAAIPEPTGRIDLPLLVENTHKAPGPDGGERFSCQATELLRAAPVCLPFRDLGQYVTDVKTGNVTAWASVKAFAVSLFNRRAGRQPQEAAAQALVQGGPALGLHQGPARQEDADRATGPAARRAGAGQEQGTILATLNEDMLNRGMGFEIEMARYCGQTARVQARVTKCLDEKTGELLTMKSPCIILEDIVCAGVYNSSCPREFVPFWREIWLERV